jgi:anti-sigma B factor antagonist
MLEITTDPNGTLHLIGTLDASQAELAQKHLDAIVSSLTVDCGDLNYISSAGLGVFIATHKRLSDRGEKLTLINVTSHIRELLRYTGLDKVFQIN